MNEVVRRLPLLLLLAACVTGCGEKKDGGAAESPADDAAVTASSAELAEVHESGLTSLVDLVVAEADKLPEEEFDPGALATKLGKDPKAHLAWVRDHTWWAPYRGLLRGSAGVMLDRVGSHLDRAVLLGDLLRRAGHDVRFGRAELPAPEAMRLQANLRPIPDRGRTSTGVEELSAEQMHLVERWLPKDGPTLADEISDSKRRVDEAKALVRLQSEQLYSAVKGSAVEDREAGQRTLAALQDYWWVERLDNGEWIAMDLTAPDGQKREGLSGATRTSVWKSGDDPPPVPDRDWHSVQVRVLVERYEEGSTQEHVALDTILRPAEVFDRPVMLAHFPKPWPELLPDTQADPNALGNAAVAVKEWVPFLIIGDRPVVQSGFTESGQLVADPLSPARDVAETGGAGFMSGFGEALGGGESPSSSITAEWIDYEIRVPGQPPQQLRRPVFDLLGPTNRARKVQDFDANSNERLVERYEALLGTTNILLQPCEFPEEFLAYLLTRSIVTNQSAFRAIAREKDPAKAAELASGLLGRLERWGPLPAFAFWRTEIGGSPRSWFIDRPNVLNFRVSPAVVNADSRGPRGLMDVAANPIGVRDGGRGFEIRVRQGVADTVAEMLAIGGDVSGSANTSSLFKTASASFQEGRRIAPNDAAAVHSLSWPEDTAARLAQDLDAGFMAVALHKPVSIDGSTRVGWWRISPTTGETIGVMDTGFHAGETEYAKLIELMNALNNFLRTHAASIQTARQLPSLTPGQSLLLRAAVAAERALEAFASSRQPF